MRGRLGSCPGARRPPAPQPAASEAWPRCAPGLPFLSALARARALPPACPAGLAHHPPTSRTATAGLTGHRWLPVRACAVRRGRTLPGVSATRCWGRRLCTRLRDIRVLRTLHYISHRPPGHVQTADLGSESGVFAQRSPLVYRAWRSGLCVH